ncbi:MULTISPECIES: hypothetical protein [unclassified Yoonia]|uniref:hypothetical protein n=1 Tax=unclassified Yoonia TaxID=2629118 RepID=UPI002AFF03D6|nr:MULTISPECIES: hypothetical protein [unclassified Yoonia]
MNFFVFTYALRFVVVFVGTLVVLMVPVGLVTMLLIAVVVILAVMPDPFWIVRKMKAILLRKTGKHPELDD